MGKRQVVFHHFFPVYNFYEVSSNEGVGLSAGPGETVAFAGVVLRGVVAGRLPKLEPCFLGMAGHPSGLARQY